MKQKITSGEISNLIKKENKGRERFKGFAIDKLGTHRPEDVLHARRQELGSRINVVGSVVEVGLLDRTGESVHCIADDLRKGKEPTLKLPQHRGSFTFWQRRVMPCISVAGAIDSQSNEIDVNIVRSRVFARRFQHDSERLQTSTAYHAALEASSAMSGRAIKGNGSPNRSQRISNGYMAVTAFANMFNGAISEWTVENDIPQLYRHYPALIDIGDSTLETALFSSLPGSHAGFEGKSHAKTSTPCTQIETWINMVAITSFLDEGEAAFGHDEVDLIANWMNQTKIARLEKRIA